MKFSTLVFEGEKTEKQLGSKCLYCQYFHITRMLSELLKGINLDGSVKLTVIATPAPKEKYIQNKFFNVSMYYLDENDISLIKAKKTDDSIVLQILVNALLDIAKTNNCDEFIIKKINDAATLIKTNNFVYSEKIHRLSKKTKRYHISANIYRTFSKQVGEGWDIRLMDLAGNTIYAGNMINTPSYVDRLYNYYSQSTWIDTKFVVFDRFGKEVYALDISNI